MDNKTEELIALHVERKTGKEPFINAGRSTEFTLLDFWRWSCSDVVSNATRGRLAEYIVGCDLGVNGGTSIEWDAYDLITPSGIRVEVKSAVYLQSWHQNALSAICFDIRPTYGWDAGTNTASAERKRQADIYVFCLLKHTVKETLDPFDLSQWEFYVFPASELDEKLPNQKTITLSSLLRLGPIKTEFGKIGEAIQRVAEARREGDGDAH